jgi:hypothetical protein
VINDLSNVLLQIAKFSQVEFFPWLNYLVPLAPQFWGEPDSGLSPIDLRDVGNKTNQNS